MLFPLQRVFIIWGYMEHGHPDADSCNLHQGMISFTNNINKLDGGREMNNKGIGAVFCLISAILMSTRYLAAAIFMNGVPSWNDSLFSSGLTYVGSPLKIAAIIALMVGIAFLGYGLYQDIKEKRK